VEACCGCGCVRLRLRVRVRVRVDLWCVDFKGHFPVGSTRCHPLTIMDAHSRYLIAVIGLTNTQVNTARRAFEKVFAEFGLPSAIRSDNGVPFACKGLGGLTQLSAWWLKLGIRHERIEPGSPEQNGRHERMHRTLKEATAMPPCASIRKQQRAFDLFRREYNHERPHEALSMQVPADHFARSLRALPEPAWGRDFRYPENFETVRVSRLGHLPWNGRSVYLSTALQHQLVGLEWQDGGAWNVYFGEQRLGKLSPLNRKSKMQFTEEKVSPMSLD
jgi:putative transposase